MGESIYQVEIVQWHKHEGQSVEKDENLVEMETDKATVELPSPAAGVVAENAETRWPDRGGRRDRRLSSGAEMCSPRRLAGGTG